MRHILKHIIFAAVLPLIVGCKSSQHSSSEKYASPVTDVADNYRLLVADYHDWHDVTMPVKVSLQEPTSMSVSARARIIRGESLMISFRVFGMEMAQMYLDNDSVHAFYKLKKLYLSESIDEIKGDFPLSLENIQDLLLGRAFIFGDSRLDAGDISNVSLEAHGQNWNIIPRNAPHGIDYGFLFSPGNLITRCVACTSDQSILAIAEYSDHQSTPAGNLAGIADISLSKGSHSVKLSLSWNLGDAQWNTNATNQWKAPKGYSRIRAGQLLKAISQN